MPKTNLLSVVVPIYNEAAGLSEFNQELSGCLNELKHRYELIYVNDGSSDDTQKVVARLAASNKNIRLVSLSRNFGKENALAAGIASAKGDAILMLDGDGQHPPSRIKAFINAWQKGSDVVVGVRAGRDGASKIKNLSSTLFYSLFNKLTDQKIIPGSTDFRLIDRRVADVFISMNETDRITRGLIDWLGFKRSEVHFEAAKRLQGSAGYSMRKLTRLATNSFVSMTPVPLYIFGYLGVLITIGSFLLGLAVIIEQIILNDPHHWHFSGTAMLGILILFLVGIVLMSQGILSLYISHIHSQAKGRPLYIIDKKNSLL